MASIDAIVNRQLLLWESNRDRTARETEGPPMPPQIVTVSRQTGSRGSWFATRLAEELGYQRMHREIIDAICRSSGYRRRVVESIDYHVRGDLELAVESVITGQSVDLSDYVKHLIRVLLSVSQLGGVVVLGRAANFILGPNRGVHFRIVCPRDKRILNMVKYRNLTEREAERLIAREDTARAEFVSKVFDRDIDDAEYYDATFNTSLIDVEEMVQAATVAIKTKLDKVQHMFYEPA